MKRNRKDKHILYTKNNIFDFSVSQTTEKYIRIWSIRIWYLNISCKGIYQK